MPIVYRPASAQDLQRSDELVVRSINDLTERHGFGQMASASPPHFQRFSLNDDPAGLWVAEDAGEMVGFAFSWMCGDLWFLAQLFVSPEQQGRGVGNALIERTLHHAQKAGATNKALITFTFNRVSQGLYIRHGMFPRLPLYFFSVTRERLKDRLRDTQLRKVPIEPTEAHLRRLAEIDASALGISREKHHRFLLSNSDNTGVFLYCGDACVGYAYVSSSGHIGPLALTPQADPGAAFAAALGLAADIGATQVSAFIPGTSETALRSAVEYGMRITFPMVLLSTRDFGDWSRYLPRNPGFM